MIVSNISNTNEYSSYLGFKISFNGFGIVENMIDNKNLIFQFYTKNDDINIEKTLSDLEDGVIRLSLEELSKLENGYLKYNIFSLTDSIDSILCQTTDIKIMIDRNLPLVVPDYPKVTHRETINISDKPVIGQININLKKKG